MGLYLLARDPRKPVLVLAAVGLTSFASVVALDAVRVVSGSAVLSSIEVYLVAVPGIAWFAVLLELSRPYDTWRSRAGEIGLVTGVARWRSTARRWRATSTGRCGSGHWVMIAAISLSTLGAMVRAVLRRCVRVASPASLCIATLFFALANAILIVPLGLVPSWLALASTGFDVALLGVAVAMWRRVRRGAGVARRHAALVRGDGRGGDFCSAARRSSVLPSRRQETALTVLLFTSLAIAITINVLADPLAGVLDRLAFSRSPALRADRAALRRTEAALPLRSDNPLDNVDEDTFAPAHPSRARPLRRPVQACRQPADRIADHRRTAGRARRA